MPTVDRQSELMQGLDFLWLEITERCNLACTHCYAESSPHRGTQGELTYDNWVRVLDQASELGCRKVQFIGGEPTLHPRLVDLIAYANQRNFQFVEVFTNATLLSPELIGCFYRYRVNLATSFYSDLPDTHESITNGKGSWHRTVAGIRNVVEAGLPLRVGIIEMEQNEGRLTSTTSFLEALGVTDIGTDRKRSIGRARLMELETPVEQLQELCGQCWKGKLCVVATGDVFPCVFARETSLGSIDQGLAYILSSAKLCEFRTAVRELQQQRFNSRRRQTSDQAFAPQMRFYPFDSSCSPILWCKPDYCKPNDCKPNDCTPTRCFPGPGCDPDHCQPERCDPDYCQPERCDPDYCQPERCDPDYYQPERCDPERSPRRA